MPKILNNTKRLMARLYAEDLSVGKIARKANVSYTTAYNYTRARQRQNLPENKELTKLIERALKDSGENQSWLARKIGVSREAISKYCQGKYTPRKKVLRRLFSVLDVPYDTLDELLDAHKKQKALN